MTWFMTSRNVQQVTILIGLSMLVWMLALSGCGGTVVGSSTVEQYNQNPMTVTIPSNLSPQEVEQTMVLTLKGRQWTVLQQSPQAVVGQLNHRQFQAKTTLKVDGDVIRILSDSYYKGDESTKLEPGVPKGWLKNLQADLRTRLTRQAAQK